MAKRENSRTVDRCQCPLQSSSHFPSSLTILFFKSLTPPLSPVPVLTLRCWVHELCIPSWQLYIYIYITVFIYIYITVFTLHCSVYAYNLNSTWLYFSFQLLFILELCMLSSRLKFINAYEWKYTPRAHVHKNSHVLSRCLHVIFTNSSICKDLNHELDSVSLK